MDFSKLAIGGVLLIPLIVGLLQVIKRLGMSGNALIYTAMGIGGLVGLIYKLSLMYPIIAPWVELLVFVVGFALFALAATGLYDVGKTWFKGP